MGKTYFYPKKNFLKEKFCEMQVHFKNGDYIIIKKNEFLKVEVKFLDELVIKNNRIWPLVHDGKIKTRVNFSKRANCNYCRVYNPKEYIADRKTYIEERCQKQGEIDFLHLSDDLNWGFDLCGNITAKKEGDYLIFEFNTSGNFESENASLNIANFTKQDIRWISLDFETCEGINVFQDEIVDMNLDFNEELIWGGSQGFMRQICGGFLKIKFGKTLTPRDYFLFEENIKRKDFEKRICGKSGFSDHDICHLNIDYMHGGFWGKECLTIEDIRDFEYLPDEDDYDHTIPYFVGGYAEKQKDGSIFIAFGKATKKTIEEKLKKTK